MAGIAWHEGAKGVLTSHFTALHLRPAHRDENRREFLAEFWLLVEWPVEAPAPAKY